MELQQKRLEQMLEAKRLLGLQSKCRFCSSLLAGIDRKSRFCMC